MSLQNKVAIVTGGNSGIGQAIVLALARQGADIVIDYVVHPEATEALEQQIAQARRPVHRRRGRRQQARRSPEARRRGGQRSSAGWTSWSTMPESRPAPRSSTPPRTSTTASWTINLKSAFFGTQIAAKQMIKQGGGGRIINITSVHEDWPMPGNTAYCLSKGGMRMLTRTAGVELAPHGILVVGVGPGAVATPINLGTMNDPAKLKQARRRHPARPHGRRRRSPAWSPSSPATARAI